MCIYREELEEQAEEMQEMYDKRMELLQKSMKKEFNRKRRRIEADEEGEGDGRERREVDRLRGRVSRLEEELQSEREHSEYIRYPPPIHLPPLLVHLYPPCFLCVYITIL